MRRRTFLVSATTALPVAVAGCTNVPVPGREGSAENPNGSTGAQLRVALLRMRPGDDADIGQRYARFPSRYRDPPKRGLVVTRAIENGSTKIDGEGPPARGEKPVIYEDSVYQISYKVVDERPATRYFWRFEPADDGSDDETVRFEDLPELDRERFRWEGLADGSDGQTGVTGGAFKYANEKRDESALVPTPDKPIVVWGPDRRARFEIRKTNDKNATLKTYRYSAEQVAASVEAYGQHLREQYTFELSGLTDAERDIVKEATQKHGFVVTAGDPVPDAFESVAERFRDQEAITSSLGGNAGNYLARYEDDLYTTRLLDRDDVRTETTASGE